MKINTRLNRVELAKAERDVLDKADNLYRQIEKYCDGDAREEANKAGFHNERLKKALASKELQPAEADKPY